MVRVVPARYGTTQIEARVCARFDARPPQRPSHRCCWRSRNVTSLFTSMKRPREVSSDTSSRSDPSKATTSTKRPSAKRAVNTRLAASCLNFPATTRVVTVVMFCPSPAHSKATPHRLSTPEHGLNICAEPTQSELFGSKPRSNMVSPWEFHKVPGIPDWTAAPMLAMLTLSKMMASKDQLTVRPVINPVFTELLSGDQRQQLLAL